MTILIIGLVIFLGVHSLGFLAPGWRQGLIDRLGNNGWQGLAGLVALAGLVLIVWGYGQARAVPVPLFAPPVWTRHLGLLVMLPAFPLFFAAYLPGRIKAAVGHPMLTAVILWALAHLLANGNLADLVLFGAFLIWALADRISLFYRVAPPVQGAPPGKANDLIAIVLGLAFYLGFLFWAHAWLFGVSPLGTA